MLNLNTTISPLILTREIPRYYGPILENYFLAKVSSLKSVLMGSAEVTTPKDIAKAFNDHFATIGLKLQFKLGD